MFFEQFNKLCMSINTTPTKFVKEILRLSSSKVTAWKNGSIPKYEILEQISEYFNVTVGYLFDGDKNSALTNKLTPDEQELLNNYKKLSPFNKGKISERAKILAEIDSETEKEKKKNVKSTKVYTKPGYIESYTLPASAGKGVDLDACEKIMLKVKDKELISEANFAVKISGDSMEPEFHDGEYALVRTQPKIEQGKIGIITVNADGYIKKLGAGELISLNPEYDNIPLHEYDDIRCRGEVIGTLGPEDIISTEEY